LSRTTHNSFEDIQCRRVKTPTSATRKRQAPPSDTGDDEDAGVSADDASGSSDEHGAASSKKSTPKRPRITKKPAAKKALKPVSASDLENYTREQLISHILALQSELVSSSSGASAGNLSPTEIAAKVSALRDLLARKLAKSMTWTASCKTGRARFTQDFVVTSPAVLAALFAEMDTSGKAWKMKKMGRRTFKTALSKKL